jgi:hypothetical protein
MYSVSVWYAVRTVKYAHRISWTSWTVILITGKIRRIARISWGPTRGSRDILRIAKEDHLDRVHPGQKVIENIAYTVVFKSYWWIQKLQLIRKGQLRAYRIAERPSCNLANQPKPLEVYSNVVSLSLDIQLLKNRSSVPGFSAKTSRQND